MTKEKERTKSNFDTLIKRKNKKKKSQGLDKSKKQMKKNS